jgi:hypothetical protein
MEARFRKEAQKLERESAVKKMHIRESAKGKTILMR